jgi:CheY-like chemotaxis protein
MSMAARGACVLVVDDEEDVREAVREAIEMIGATAITAGNGADALELLRTQRPCLVVLDLLMPVMTGAEMLAAMRNDPALAKLRVLISTSVPSRAPSDVPILPKPIDIERLWDCVRRSCRCGKAPAPRVHHAGC